MISGNTTFSAGGAIYAVGNELTVNNSTISGNISTIGRGGAITFSIFPSTTTEHCESSIVRYPTINLAITELVWQQFSIQVESISTAALCLVTP